MGIPIEKSFAVKAPAAAVWEFLIDPYRVARCLPGAAITDQVDEQTYGGTITVKLGPVLASYRGKMRFERLDAAAREAEITASGQETRGKGGADMRMKSRIVERSPLDTEVSVVSDVNVVGILAQFGRGMIQDVSDQLFQKFTEEMRRELETRDASATAAPTPMVAESPPAATAIPSSTPPIPLPSSGENVLDAGALGAGAARRAIARGVRRPSFWVAVIVLALLVAWLICR